MAATQKLRFEIDANKNRASRELKELHAEFTNLGKPVETFSKTTSRVFGNSVLGRFTGVLGDAHGAVTDLIGGMGEAASTAEGMGGAMAAAGLGVAVLGGAAVAATGVAVAFANKWSAGAAQLGRDSALIGVAADRLQLLGRAAQYGGVETRDTTASLHSLGTVLNDIQNGRNNEAAAMAQQVGLQVRFKNGVVDSEQALMDLADVIKRQTNPQSQEMVAAMFGVTALLPELRKGAKGFADDLARAKAAGPLISDRDIQTSQQFQGNLKELKQEAGSLGNVIGNKLLPPLTRALHGLNEFIQHSAEIHHQNEQNGAVFVPGGAVGYGVAGGGHWEMQAGKKHPWEQPIADAVREFRELHGGKPGGGAADAIKSRLQAMGLTDAQAKGVVAGIYGESRLDAGAVNPTSGAFGLDQWLGPRKRELFRRFGPNPSRDQQIQFMLDELGGSESGALTKIRGDNDAGSAMRDFLAYFERPGAGLAGDVARGSRFLGGQIDVVVHIPNAPAGTTAVVSSSQPDKVAGSVRIGLGMPMAGVPVAAGAG